MEEHDLVARAAASSTGDVIIGPQFDPYTAGIGRCPHGALNAVRDELGVHEVPGQNFFLVTRHADCLAVLNDVEAFSNDHDLLLTGHGEAIGWCPPAAFDDVAAIYAGARPNIETLHFLDPPLHTQQRRRINRWFTSKRAQQSWRPIVEELVDDLIDGFAADGRVELVGQFAVPLPIRAIAAILGVPFEREVEFKAWSDAFVAGMGARLDHRAWIAKAEAHVAMQEFFVAEIEARLAEPRDDLLGELVAAAGDVALTGMARRSGPDEPFSALEILNAVQHLLAAGNETTTQALALAMRLVVEHPEVLAAIHDTDDDSVAGAVAEEALRVEPPVLGMWRYCRIERTIGGVLIPAGALVAVMFAAANRDPAAFEQPDEFCPTRARDSRHLAFGHGAHFCVGAGLARLELVVAIRRLVARLPGLRAEPGAALPYGDSFMLRSLHELPLLFEAR